MQNNYSGLINFEVKLQNKKFSDGEVFNSKLIRPK